jgi:predicted nucleic acid-binding protein
VITAVDTSVLLDIFFPDPAFGPTSKERLRRASQEGALVVCEVVYAELAGLFPQRSALDTFLGQAGIRLESSTLETLWKAGDLWRRFCLERPRRSMAARRILADFLIGAHALHQADRLLSRDKDFYGATFKGLHLA